jgi:tRNA G37 N-methylase Trm5
LYTFSDEVVLDPFMGSGQTALAALKAGRNYVGYEVNPTYVKLAEGELLVGMIDQEIIRQRLKNQRLTPNHLKSRAGRRGWASGWDYPRSFGRLSRCVDQLSRR